MAGLRVALVRPRCDCPDPEFQEPLGAEAICGYLREKNIRCEVFDRLLGVTASDIDAFQPDFIGFSLMTNADVPDALRLRQILGRGGRRFFAGGLFVTTCPEQARALFPADTALISGEGEGPVLELVTAGRPLGRLFPSPDEWAFASRDRLDEYLARGGVINIRASRGCRGACAFCTTPRAGRPMRHQTRSVEKIADEMQRLIQAGHPAVFNFTDDMFGDHTRIEALERTLSERNLRAAFTLEMRAQEVAKTPVDLWPALHAGGLCRVFTGLESLNPDTLAAWNKTVPIPELKDALKVLRACGIACEVGYILWHQETTPQSAWEEAEALHELSLLSPKSALSRLVLYPGSLLHARMQADGVALCPLGPGAQRQFRRWEALLMELRQLWYSASCVHPKMVCDAFLSAACVGPLRALEACLERIRDLTYQTLREDREPDETELQTIRGELLALHSAAAGRR
ncbi:MAG: radical SAM protein [Clostridia bacterium]|nr:radical SAM protein [Clostridia bacterium]